MDDKYANRSRGQFDPVDDEPLALSYAAGTEQEAHSAYTELLTRHGNWLKAHSLRLCGGNHTDADDLYQELCMQLLRKRDKFTIGQGSWAAWANAVLRGCASGFRRKKKSQSRHVVSNEEFVEYANSAERPAWYGLWKVEFGKAFVECFASITDEQK